MKNRKNNALIFITRIASRKYNKSAREKEMPKKQAQIAEFSELATLKWKLKLVVVEIWSCTHSARRLGKVERT